MCCEKECRPLRLITSIITFLACAFDSSIDWYAFSQFVQYDQPGVDRKLTAVLGILCGVATIIFCLEIRNAVQSFKLYTSSEDDISSEESSLDKWQDVVSFLQVVLQDCPMAIIIFVQFQKGSCELYRRLFEDTFTGNLVVIAMLVCTGWKVVMSLFLCCCGCGRGDKGCGWRCCCCVCRIVRSILSVLLLGFSIYLLFDFNGRGLGRKDEFACPDGSLSQTIFDYIY